MNDNELLQHIHPTAQMGRQGIFDVLGYAKDETFRQALNAQMNEYKDLANRSGELLYERGEQPKEIGTMAKVSSEVMSTVKTLSDHSPSKIAEMMIQGNTMGITKSTKCLNDYTGTDPGVRKLADCLLKTEQANVEQMKKYL